MIESLPLNTTKKETEKQLLFMNAFGALFNNYFVVYNNSTKLTIRIEDTRSVIFRKKRKITKNIFLLVFGVFTGMTIYYSNLSSITKISCSSFAVLFFILGLLFKEYKYHFIIIKQDDFILFEVRKNLKEDAKKIQRVVKEKLKKKQTTLL